MMPMPRPATRLPLRPVGARRGLWLALALLVLAVQTGIAVHQETHPLGQSDIQCHYCALGGHAFGMPNALPLPAVAAALPAPVLPALQSLVSAPAPRGFLSRAPPPETQA